MIRVKYTAGEMYHVKMFVHLFLLIVVTHGAQIFSIMPIYGRSHWNVLDAVLQTLVSAGHNVTVVTPFIKKEKIANYTQVMQYLPKIIEYWKTTVNSLLYYTIFLMKLLLTLKTTMRCYIFIVFMVCCQIIRFKNNWLQNYRIIITVISVFKKMKVLSKFWAQFISIFVEK